MGSDLHMNPPRPDSFRAVWRGNDLVIERSRDSIYGQAAAAWHKIRTYRNPSQDTLDAIKLFGWPIEPRSPQGKVIIETYVVAQAECQVIDGDTGKHLDSWHTGTVDTNDSVQMDNLRAQVREHAASHRGDIEIEDNSR